MRIPSWKTLSILAVGAALGGLLLAGSLVLRHITRGRRGLHQPGPAGRQRSRIEPLP